MTPEQQVTTTTTHAPPATPSEECGGPRWKRVAFINMSDPNQNCPEGFIPAPYTRRSCGRRNRGPEQCTTVNFPVSGDSYSQVCGRAVAYRWGFNYGFYGYHVWSHNLNGAYVDGLSLTHGSPRTHIWTFASGQYNGTSGDRHGNARCPCDEGNSEAFGAPPFVGNDYFCDSVNNFSVNPFRFYPTDALWDGKGCQGNRNVCCQQNNPPCLKKMLPTTTADDIELRMCFVGNDGTSNIGIELLELYVS